MSRYPFLQVDAFADRPLTGNPCAVILDADNLTAATMQQIAAEQNQAESAFVMASTHADFRARYFTPAGEIPLAGHPTIAVVTALLDQRRIAPTEESVSLKLELTAGVIDIQLVRRNGLPFVTMHQLAPRFGASYAAEEVMPAFGLTAADALSAAPICTVSTGTPQLMVPVATLDALRRATLDISRYAALRERGDFFSPHLFCLTGVTPAGQTFARHFGMPPDRLEDPFTGSATGGMAAYCWRYGLLDEPEFVAEQGHWMGRPGRAHVTVSGSRLAMDGIAVAGSGIVVIRGQLTLDKP